MEDYPMKIMNVALLGLGLVSVIIAWATVINPLFSLLGVGRYPVMIISICVALISLLSIILPALRK